MKYAIVVLIVFAILTFLKFCEGSPFRSWKSVILTGIPLSLIIGYYLGHAFQAPTPPPSAAARISAHRSELQRNLRHIAGVNQATINDHQVQLDLAGDQPLAELRSLALQSAGRAAFYLELGPTNQLTVLISVNGRNRYQMIYTRKQSVVDETTF